MSSEEAAVPSNSTPRCWLSIPASRPGLFAKAAATGVDGVIVDLEDAVAPSEKATARVALATGIAELAAPRPAPHICVRVNAPRSRWCHLDIAAVTALAGAAAIMLPKVECAGDIAFVDRLLDGVEHEYGRTEPIGVHALIESAAGLANVREIASAAARLSTLVIGYADLGASLGRAADLHRDRWLYAQESVLVAARAAGLAAVDGPYLGVDVDEEFLSRVEHAARLGFDGKWVIHPRQVDAATAAFTPDADEIAKARAVLRAMRDSHENGTGAALLDGTMIDEAVAVWARRVLSSGRGEVA